MGEYRCPACGGPTGSRGNLCPACCTSGYCQDLGYGPSEDLERGERELTEDLEGWSGEIKLPSRVPTKEDLERLKRVEQWKEEMDPSSKPNTSDSPMEVEGQSPKKRKTTKYTSSQVATAAGRAVAAVGGVDNLPLEGQKEALELARRWLAALDE